MTRVTMTGNVTADPVRRQTNGGDPVVSFDVADTERVYDRQANEWKDGATTFLRCVAFRDMAKHIAESVRKGTRVVVVGDLKPNNYEKDGQMRYGFQLEVVEVGPSLRFRSYVPAPDQGQQQPSGRRAATPADQPF